LRLGTRGSQLALWQARLVASRIAETGGPACGIVVIKTSGDHLQDAPLAEVGGKRLFVKEIEDALLRGEIDLAVHSSKDMPAMLPDPLAIAAVLPREDPRDAVVLPASSGGPSQAEVPGPSAAASETPADLEALVARLGGSPAIGTSSVRRVAQLSRLFPGARFRAIRGNLDTRLRKLDQGEHDALVLAAAGLRRLGFAPRIALALPAKACVPAPGQGIIAIETRAGDEVTRAIVEGVDDPSSRAALIAERTVVEALGGGCQTPIGALASPVGSDTLELLAVVVSLDGARALEASGRGSRSEAAALGRQVAGALLEQGAAGILAAARTAHGAVEGIQP
jgi:hydroxymethylbilane synthase